MFPCRIDSAYKFRVDAEEAEIVEREQSDGGAGYPFLDQTGNDLMRKGNDWVGLFVDVLVMSNVCRS